MIKNNFIILYIVGIVLLNAKNNMAMDYSDITPQEQIFLELLTNNQHLSETEEQTINGNNNSNYPSKEYLQKEDLLQNQQNYKTTKIVNTEQQSICPECNKTLSNKGNLKKHIDTVHTDEKSFKCSYCDASFKHNVTLNKHEIKHINSFICIHCNEKFDSQNLIEKHIANQHKTLNTFICPYPNCGKKFTLENYLRNHTQRHNKKYNCSYCEKKFSTERELIAHERTHTGEKIPCTYDGCDKTFVSKSNLSRHIKNYHK